MNSNINRRSILKAAGVSLALPLLESMNSAFGSCGSTPPKRLVFICTALGLHPPDLWPKKEGKDYELTPYLKLLEKHRSDFSLFHGLQHEDQTGRQPHDSEMTWLTAARKPGMGGFQNTISIDQVAARKLGKETRFSSISLGTLKSQSQSYTSGGVMIPSQTSPAKLFADLFLQGKRSDIQKQRRYLDDGKSILDQLGSQAKSLRRKSSAADNHLLDDYFESVRTTERNIQDLEGWLDRPKPRIDAKPPTDIGDKADLIGRTQLLMDMVPLIVQTDSSRVVSVMIQDHYAVPKVEGVDGNHHNLSHHGQDPAKIGQLQKIEKGIVSCFGNLLSDMKSRAESGSNLLDNTSIIFGSNLGNANAHHANNLPILLAGGGYEHGRYIKKPGGTPLCNMFVSILQNAGVDLDSFGQSTGTLDW